MIRRPRSTIAPITHSLTEAMNPALACVTRIPAALAAATSTLRMSIAQRENATRSGLAAKSSGEPGVCRYETMTSQPRAASISSGMVSSRPAVLKRTSPSVFSPATARSP